MSEHKACCPHLIPWPDGKACRVCYDAKEAEVEKQKFYRELAAKEREEAHALFSRERERAERAEAECVGRALEQSKAQAEVERLRIAGQRCMEISTGLAAAEVVGHMDILNVMSAALRGGGEQCLCDDDSPNHCTKCTRELLRGGGE